MVSRGGFGKSHPNLALIKYWGKKDVAQNIPSNMSVSIPLTGLTSETTVESSETDEFSLDGKKLEIKERMRAVIDAFRKRAGDSGSIRIASRNNFPSSCGLASSASGFAALVLALDSYYGLSLAEEELSKMARLGSGSASRSIPQGIVVYKGLSSRHLCFWPELRVLSIMLCSRPKKVSSTEGMLRTAATSHFYRERLARVDENADEIAECILRRDFAKVAEMTMRDSNEMHAVFMETYPPIRYITDEGFGVIEKCHAFNRDGIKVAYTFDAGPNPFLITLAPHMETVMEHFSEYDLKRCN
jgi:diphosphomevalonate decarboxylase